MSIEESQTEPDAEALGCELFDLYRNHGLGITETPTLFAIDRDDYQPHRGNIGLAYANLDAETRLYMVEEIDMAVADKSIYLSPWLSPQGLADWSALLRTAAQSGNDESLATELRKSGRVNITAQRRKPRSTEMTTYRVPDTAPLTMAEGEFNRFYCRGLCRQAIATGVTQLEVYRAKQVEQPRRESEEKIGSRVDPKAILEDLRTSPGVEPALGLPPGPNSGLTLKIS